MKILKSIVIFGILVSIINCRCRSLNEEDDDYDYLNYDDKTASKKNCPKREFSPEEKEKDAYKCCYIQSECNLLDVKTTYKGCDYLQKKYYDDIENFKKEAKEVGKCDKLEIDCNGNALKKLLYSTFILLFIL